MTARTEYRKRNSIQTCCVSLVATLGFAAMCAAHDVVIQREVNLRAGPNTQSEIIQVLKVGEEARLLKLEQENNYYQVLHDAGVGWVWARNVSVFPEYLPEEQWRHWTDADGDCQHARQEVFIAESEIAVTFTDPTNCTVASGRWTDPYSGEIFTDPKDLAVDHVVPLRNAHRSGGWQWTKQRREQYANDLDNPEHLVAVKASLVRSKGDKGPDKWLPPNQDYHCQYVRDWQTIKKRWELAISPAEMDAIKSIEKTCPQESASPETTLPQ